MPPDPAVNQAIEDLLRLKDSAGWKLLVAWGETRIAYCKDQLVITPPTDTPAIIELQQEARFYGALQTVIDELCQSAVQSEQGHESDTEDGASADEDSSELDEHPD